MIKITIDRAEIEKAVTAHVQDETNALIKSVTFYHKDGEIWAAECEVDQEEGNE